MRQKRICSYYRPQCKHIAENPPTFFTLSESVRDQIYRHVGLVHDTTIRIFGQYFPSYLKNRWNSRYIIGAILNIGGSHPFSFITTFEERQRNAFLCITTETYDETAACTPHINLGLSNSAVSADVARFLLSHNKVLLCCDDFTHLTILLDTPLPLIHSLTHLTIHLNVTSRYSLYRYTARNCYHRSHFDGPNEPPLVSKSHVFQAFLPLWHQVVAYLRLSPSNPKLMIQCDVGDHQTARLVVDPLEKAGLATHTIRLGPHRDHGLTQIARQAIFRSRGETERCFRFMDLPTELRQHVLSFTDILAPWRTVICLPDGKLHGNVEWLCDHQEFCAYRRAVSPPCSCWMPPSALFTVSKAMLLDVKAVFFSSNTFDIPLQRQLLNTLNRFPGPPDDTVDNLMQQLLSDSPNQSAGALIPASTILRKWIRQDAFRHLRKLRIDVNADLYHPGGIDYNILGDWAHKIKQMAGHARALTLSVHLGHNLRYSPSMQPELPHVGTVDEALDTLYGIYEHIFRPFQILAKEGLDHFFVYALSPFEASVWEPPIPRLHLLKLETRLETMVMGCGYDSQAHVKQKTLERELCGHCAYYLKHASLDIDDEI